MTDEERIAETKAVLQRSAYLVDGVYPDYVACQVEVRHHGYLIHNSGPMPLKKASRLVLRLSIPHARRSPRPAITIWLWTYNVRGILVKRSYQLRSPPVNPDGFWILDMQRTPLSLVVQSYKRWTATVFAMKRRVPWTPRSYRPTSEGSNLTLFTFVIRDGQLTSKGEHTYTSYSRNYQGTRTPGFGKIKKRALPVNDYSLSMFRKGDFGEYYHWVRLNPSTGQPIAQQESVQSFGLPGGDPSASFDASLYDKALKRLIDRAEVGLDSNLAQDLVQIQQTIDLISGSSRRIASSVTALKRGNFNGAIKALWRNQNPRFRKDRPSFTSDLANNWLELQYGWKPLLSDIRGSMEALARLNLADTAVRRISSSASRKVDKSTPLNTNDADPTTIGSVVQAERRVCRLVVRYRVASPLTAFLAQTGFTNPINLIWEIVPYSFVIDWFLPIGPWLSTISAWHGLEFKDGSRTDFALNKTRAREFFVGQAKVDDQWTSRTYHALYFKDSLLLRRLRLLTFPSATLPELKHGLSTTHALNGLSLLRQAFK